jgi:hypothetical protein
MPMCHVASRVCHSQREGAVLQTRMSAVQHREPANAQQMCLEINKSN